jgi:hypothetical protein
MAHPSITALTVSIADSVRVVLERGMVQEKISLTEAVRRAICLYKIRLDVLAEDSNSRLVVISEVDGKTIEREVNFYS